ncbi:MAG: IclR family transcriptional regulator [Halalkalicoccus sp.]
MADASYPVGAAATTIRVTEALADGGEMGVTELATELGLSKSAVHKHLTTLEQLGYVVGEGGRYRLGLGFLSVGLAARDRLVLYRTGRTVADDLAGTTGEITSLVVPESGEGVYAYQATADRERDTWLRIGERAPLHATAGGKAILAHLPTERVAAIVDGGLPAFTDGTQTEPDRLRRELDSIRERGLAFDRGEYRADWQCVAAPVLVDGRVIGSITVSGPTERMSGKTLEEDVAGLVVSASNAIEVASLSE